MGPNNVIPLMRRRRPGRRLRAVLRVLVALILALALLGLAFSPIFQVRTVRVQGGPQSLGIEIGVPSGTPIWRANLARARTRLLQREPELASVQVGRLWPNAIAVRVSYRQPVAVAVSPAGQLYGVDATGRVLSVRSAPRGLPLLAGVASASIRQWSQIRARGLLPALRVAASLERLHFPFAQVVAGSTTTIYLVSGTQVRWPRASNAEATLAALKTVLTALARRGEVAAMIDLTSPSRPLVVFRR